MNINSAIELKANPQIPPLAAGDVVKVRTKVVEGEKVRTQVFQGVVIRVKHGGASACFTVRRVTYGVGVERCFPIYSPLVEGVDVVRHGRVRRARLYYLRGLSARASRIKERRVAELVPTEGEAPKPEEMAPPAAEAAPVTATAPEAPKAEVATAEAPKAEVKETPKAEVKEAPKAEAPPATPTVEDKKSG